MCSDKVIIMKKNLKELTKYFSIILIVLLLKVLLVDVVSVEGISMYPTLNGSNDKVVLERYRQFTEKYNRGDIVVIDLKEKHIIKRIIGLPNDLVEIKNNDVYINGELIEEDYLSRDTATSPDLKVEVPYDEVFVMGDNRENSLDSRKLGTISIDSIEGKASFRFNIKTFIFNILK